jgi:hypothetical protein
MIHDFSPMLESLAQATGGWASRSTTIVYLAELSGLRDQLNAGLLATAHTPSQGEGPSVSELADRIKTLKAARIIEAAPQRVRKKQSAAEEPVTARIRRLQEAYTVLHQAVEHDGPSR